MVDCSPFMEPGQDPTYHVNTAVTGCRFLEARTGVNEVAEGLVGKAQVRHVATAGGPSVGVAARDKLAGEKVLTFRRGILPIETGAALAHGQRVMSDNQGRAIPYVNDGAGANIALGTCLADQAFNAGGNPATYAKIAVAIGA